MSDDSMCIPSCFYMTEVCNNCQDEVTDWAHWFFAVITVVGTKYSLEFTFTTRCQYNLKYMRWFPTSYVLGLHLLISSSTFFSFVVCIVSSILIFFFHFRHRQKLIKPAKRVADHVLDLPPLPSACGGFTLYSHTDSSNYQRQGEPYWTL